MEAATAFKDGRLWGEIPRHLGHQVTGSGNFIRFVHENFTNRPLLGETIGAALVFRPTYALGLALDGSRRPPTNPTRSSRWPMSLATSAC